MMGLAKYVESTRSALLEQATVAFMMLRAAKDISASTTNTMFGTEAEANFAPTLAYERARGIIDTIQDISYALLGDTDTDAMLSDAAKAAGYKITTQNKNSIHAHAALAEHAASRPTYASSAASTGSSVSRPATGQGTLPGTENTRHSTATTRSGYAVTYSSRDACIRDNLEVLAHFTDQHEALGAMNMILKSRGFALTTVTELSHMATEAVARNTP